MVWKIVSEFIGAMMNWQNLSEGSFIIWLALCYLLKVIGIWFHTHRPSYDLGRGDKVSEGTD